MGPTKRRKEKILKTKQNQQEQTREEFYAV